MAKHRESSSDILPGRRNQEQLGIKNANKVKNYTIGQDTPAVRGGDRFADVQKRSGSTYNQSMRGEFTNQFIEANSKAKN